MYYTLAELRDLKRAENMKILVNRQGDLSIQVPRNTTEEKASELSEKVLNLDYKYNESGDKLAKMVSEHRTIYSSFHKPMYKSVKDLHNEVYDK